MFCLTIILRASAFHVALVPGTRYLAGDILSFLFACVVFRIYVVLLSSLCCCCPGRMNNIFLFLGRVILFFVNMARYAHCGMYVLYAGCSPSGDPMFVCRPTRLKNPENTLPDPR